jgi:hypothetical protein
MNNEIAVLEKLFRQKGESYGPISGNRWLSVKLSGEKTILTFEIYGGMVGGNYTGCEVYEIVKGKVVSAKKHGMTFKGYRDGRSGGYSEPYCVDINIDDKNKIISLLKEAN